jgi:hypothetical protein
MRKLVALGALSMASALSVACSDDEGSNPQGNGGRSGGGGSGGTAGTGATGGTGTSGGGGDAGSGGTAGVAGAAGASGAAGAAGAAGNGGDGPGNDDPDAGDAGGASCGGCLELRVPVVGNDKTTLFQVDFGGDGLVDMSGATVTFHLKASPLNDQLTASPFATDSEFSFASRFTQLNAGNGFDNAGDTVDITFDIAGLALPDQIDIPDGGPDGGIPDPADFDKRAVRILGIQVGSAGAFGDSATATEIVLIDSITFTGVDPITRPDFDFTDDVEGWTLPVFDGQQTGSVLIHRP